MYIEVTTDLFLSTFRYQQEPERTGAGMRVRMLLAATALALLGACGGGGGGGTVSSAASMSKTVESTTDTLSAGGATADESASAIAAAGQKDAVSASDQSGPAMRPLVRSPLGLHTPTTFSPSTITGNQTAGFSGSYVIKVTVGSAELYNANVYASIRDTGAVLSQTAGIPLVSIDRLTYALTLRTSAALPVGRYQGTLFLSLCKDVACAQPYTGEIAQLPYDFAVTTKALTAFALTSTNATAYVGGANPQDAQIAISGPADDWSAETDAPWLSVIPTTGTIPANSTTIPLRVRYAIQGLGVGRYQAQVFIKSAGGQRVAVPFTLEMLPRQLTVSTNSLSFVGVNGSPIPPQTLNFTLDGQAVANWSASTAAPWLLMNPTSGVTPGSLVASVDPSKSRLASGSHATSILLRVPSTLDRSIQVSLALTKPTLSASSSVITLGGPKGRDDAAQSTLMSLNTGVNSWPWTIAAPPSPWFNLSATSGTVNAGGTALEFKPNSGTAPGSYSAVVNVSAIVNDDTVTLPMTVNLNRDTRKVLPSEWGVGLASGPNGSVLARTIQVSDNFGGALPWTATSSAVWLTVTPSGTTGVGPGLTLSANPALAQNNGLSYASVTLQTSQPSVEPSVINVALWRSNNASTVLTTLPTQYRSIVADKIRPYVYAHNGGTSIDIYNAHLGAKIGTIANIAAALGDMTVSPDGSRLYALDTPNKTAVIVDLGSMSKIDTWTLNVNAPPPNRLFAIRTNGKDIVLTDGGDAYVDGKSQAFASTLFGSSNGPAFAASSDGRKLFIQDSGISPSAVASFDIDYSSMSNGILMVKPIRSTSSINSASNGQDIAVNADGTALYTASGAPYLCSRVNPDNLVFIGSLPGGDAYPNNVEVTPDGRVICGISGLYSMADIWVHAPNGALLKSFKFAGYAQALLSRQLVVTPDGMTAVGLTDDPKIAFVPIGAP